MTIEVFETTSARNHAIVTQFYEVGAWAFDKVCHAIIGLDGEEITGYPLRNTTLSADVQVKGQTPYEALPPWPLGRKLSPHHEGRARRTCQMYAEGAQVSDIAAELSVTCSRIYQILDDFYGLLYPGNERRVK